MTLVKLSPLSSLHLGTREQVPESSGEFIRSDTLFSALCHCLLLLYGPVRLQEMLCLFLSGKPPFLVSSAFPRRGDTLYFPLPKNQLPVSRDLKKVRFVARADFEKIIAGAPLDEDMDCLPAIGHPGNPRLPWSTVAVPHVSPSRTNNTPGDTFFFSGETWYQRDAGLFFLAAVRDRRWEKPFAAALRLLAEEGVGGDRSSGKGVFAPPETETGFRLEEPAGAGGLVTLSLYFPVPAETGAMAAGYYDLLERRGYVFSPVNRALRRRAVRMFEEGSVFPVPAGGDHGCLVDVTPAPGAPEIAHCVYRYGFCFPIACRVNKDED